jgi:trimeric autotransporter adhesin
MKIVQLPLFLVLAFLNCSDAAKGQILPLFGLGGGGSSGGITTAVSETASLKKVVIEPPTATIIENSHAEFTATAMYSDGSSQDVTSLVAWSISDTSMVEITETPGVSKSKNENSKSIDSSEPSSYDPSKGITGLKKGLFKGLKQGPTKVQATLESITGESVLVITAADILDLKFKDAPKPFPNGDNPFLATGSSISFSLEAILKSGKVQDLTTSVIWSVSDPSKGSIQTEGDLMGTFTALEDGTLIIKACFDSICKEFPVTISRSAIKSISLEGKEKLVKGMHTNLRAIAYYENGSHADVTSQANWLSEDKQILEVNNEKFKGKVSGLSTGSASIRASLQGINSGKTLDITAPSVVELSIEKSATIAAGYTYKYKAMALFDDEITRDVTADVTWDSDDSATAFAFNSFLQSKGSVKAEKVGTVRISASVNGITAESTFKVTPAELLSVSLGSHLVLPNGIGAKIIPMGLFSDGTKKDLSSEPNLSFSTAEGISINTHEGVSSLSTTKEGKYSLVATINASTKISSQPIEIIVSPAVLQSVSISPINLSLPKGKTQILTAKGQYSDKTEKDLTSDVTWILDTNGDGMADNGLGEISNSLTPGLVSASLEKVGNGKILAVITPPSGKMISAEVPFTVTPAVLESITVSSASVPLGVTGTIQATGFYSDKTSKDITRDASFTLSSGLSVDVFGNISTDSAGLSDGVYDIKATLDKKEAISTLTITRAVLKEISLGNQITLAKGQSTVLTAMGIYTDKSKKDISKDVFWTGNLPVSSDPLHYGSVEALAVGEYKLTASKDGITSSTTLHVSPAVLESITVEPGLLSLPKGTSQQLKVFGKYTDGKREISDKVTYSLDSNGDGEPDQLLGGIETNDSHVYFTSEKLAQIGSGTLTVSLDKVSKSIPLEIKPAILKTISISPVTVPAGVPAILTALGTYSDGTKKDITREVTFQNSASLSISQETGELPTTGIQGKYTITANLGDISTSTEVTVTEAQLVSLSVDAPSSIAKGLTTTFSAFGLYTDGSKKDLSHLVTWTSDKPNFLSTNPLTNGFFDAIQTDSIKVQASFGGTSSQWIPITIQPASLVSLQIDQPTVSLPKGTSHTFQVTGTYTDGKRDLSTSVFWELSSSSLGSISNDPATPGKFTSSSSSSTGSGKVIASVNGMKASADLEIKSAQLVSISLNAPSSLPLGVQPGITATGIYTDGTTKEITSSINWSVSGTATIDSQGRLISSGTGTSTITATLEGVSFTTSVTVKEAELVSLSVSPGLVTLAKGTTTILRATGVYTDGSNRDLTKEVFWSADATKLSVENAEGNQGHVKANQVGVASVSATFQERTGSASFLVTDAELVSIALGLPKTIPDGLTSQFTAIGTYTDGSTRDLTRDVTWSSSGKATINNGILEGGKVYTSGQETTTIRAALNGISGTTTLLVSPPEITALALSHSSLELAKGISSKLTVEAFLTNQTRIDVSPNVTWTADSNGDSKDDSTVVSISNQVLEKGILTTHAEGTATVTASLNGKSSSITVKVKPAALVSISVTPANPSISKGLSQQFTATGFYTDNSSADLTTSVSWMVGEGGSSGSSPQYSPLPSALTGGSALSLPTSTSLASISNSEGTKGKLTAQSVGSVSVVAIQGSISGSINAQLGAAALQSISVTSDYSTKSKGLTEQFKATGVYSDGTIQDLTSQVNWKTDSDAVIVSNESSTKGMVTAIGIGTSIVTGSLNGFSSSKTFTVSPATIVSIAFQNTIGNPSPNSTMPAGLQESIRAIATYTDNSSQDITSSGITWKVDSDGDGTHDTKVASVSNTGVVTTTAPGSAVITATASNGISVFKTITVQTAVLTAIEISPKTASVAQGLTQKFSATGMYSDGKPQDITSKVTWKADSDGNGSDDSFKASFNNSNTPRGIATGIQVGTANIIATYETFSSQAELTVTQGISSNQTVGSYDITIPSGIAPSTKPSGSFSGITITGSLGLSGFVSVIPDYGSKDITSLGGVVLDKILNDSPNIVNSTSIISSTSISISNGGTVVYDMSITTATAIKTTDLSNHLIQEIGVSTSNGSVSNLPIPQQSETTSTDFRAIVQVTYNQFGTEMIGVGVTKTNEYEVNQALISSFLNGTNLTVTGTTLVDKKDTFTGAADPKVDFVWVVDNSGSMAQEQKSVINNAGKFFEVLQGKHLDFNLGVIQTGNSNDCVWENSLLEIVSKTQGDAHIVKGGWTNLSKGKGAFESNVNVGISGCYYESGIHWAKYALEQKTVPNSTRTGAKLVFILVSDEGDGYGDINGGYNWRGKWIPETFNTTDNIFTQNKYKWYSIIGLVPSTGLPGTCKSYDSKGDLATSAENPNNSDTTYFNLAKATGGSSSSICSTNYSSILENIATQSAAASSSYVLSRNPISSTISVRVAGVPVVQSSLNGWMYNSANRSIIFSGTSWPEAGAAIEVIYKYDSSVAWNEAIDSLLSFFKTTFDSLVHSFSS